MDGTVEFGDGVTPTEAARTFYLEAARQFMIGGCKMEELKK